MQFVFLILSGLSAGFITAAAYVAFIAMLGIFPKIAARCKTAAHCILYENCLIAGILLATLIQFFFVYDSSGLSAGLLPPVWAGWTLLLLTGLFGGIYIGFLIGGLSEVLNVIPIYARIGHITTHLVRIIFFLALGKGIFTCIQFLILE